MTTETKKDIAEEILAAINSGGDISRYKDEPEEVKEPAPEPEIVRPALKATDWGVSEGYSWRKAPFSEIFWEPTTVPDHLVTEFVGVDGAMKGGFGSYIPPKSEFEKLSLTFSIGGRPIVVGPTGCGKTLMYEYFAYVTGRPFLRIDHNSEIDKSVVFGRGELTTDEHGTSTGFVEGVLPRAMRLPTIVVLDELTKATGYANIIYQRLLDRNELALPEMKEAGLDVLVPNEHFILGASDNTKGNGDDMDKYCTSHVQDASFVNRWDAIIEQDYLDAATEAELIRKLTSSLKPSEVTALAKLSALLHTGFKSGELTTAFSPRNLVTICKYVNAGLPLKDTLQMNYTSRVSNQEVSDVQECLRAVGLD